VLLISGAPAQWSAFQHIACPPSPPCLLPATPLLQDMHGVDKAVQVAMLALLHLELLVLVHAVGPKQPPGCCCLRPDLLPI
jgi:hypothetical protein